MTSIQKEWVDNASYEELLRKWRETPLNDPFFDDIEFLDYYVRVMGERRHELSPQEAVEIMERVRNEFPV